LVDYSEQWPLDFERERKRLADVFRGVEVEIAHVGSTAVPGLCAKPIIDICVGVSALSEAEERIASMEGLGYQYVPQFEVEIPDRRYFRRPAAKPRSHHVHACHLNGVIWTRHLAFRDWLRSHSADRDAYAALKRELHTRHMHDRPAYTEAKGPFIQAILERAGH
jgi:GrpB-like predicted nucleotidyltransferase (UPF0157 family)